MNERVTIVISAGGASERLLRTCLLSIERNSGCCGEYVSSRKVVVAPSHQASVPARVVDELKDMVGAEFMDFDVDDDSMAGSRLHGAVLDRMVPHVETPLMLTLDADCFPVREGWLKDLVGMIDDGAAVVGILHPYAPPLDGMPKTGIEYRIRSQLCWNNTHVACQLVGVDTLKRLGVGFSDGDDTGLAIPVKAREMGMKVVGWKPTRAAVPLKNCTREDLEFNRENCVLFGETMYHHGGGCREHQGRGVVTDMWRDVRERVLEECGAEWVTGTLQSHRYHFEQEEEVADRMAQGIIRGMAIYFQVNNSILG